MITQQFPILAVAFKAKEKAVESFQDTIVVVLAQLITQYQLEKIEFHRYSNSYWQKGRRVDVPELDALNDFFKLHVRPEGFNAYWSDGENWERFRGTMG